MSKQNRIIQNTAMLYLMNIAKIVFPLLTLRYLARVLSTEAYADYGTIKSNMTYIQLIIDFGFMLSGTREIARFRDDKEKVGEITGHVMLGKGFLSLVALAVLAVMTIFVKRQQENLVYTLLSFVQAATTIFLLDFLFHGLEQMHIITVRYFITRAITVVLTFVLIHDDGDMVLIPALEIVGNLVAIAWVWWELRKMEIRVRVCSLKTTWAMIKDSFVYFLSDIASTAFGALNTLLVGNMMLDQDVAYWNLAMQFVSAVQMMYNPIINSIYPHMVREKNFKVIQKVLMVFIPVIILGCVVVLFGAEILVAILGGEKYVGAASLLRWFIPLLFISFPAMLFGWPVLGAIGKTRETTITTIVTAAVQVLGLAVLALTGRFTLFNLAMLRAGTDLLMFLLRAGYCWKYRRAFKT